MLPDISTQISHVSISQELARDKDYKEAIIKKIEDSGMNPTYKHLLKTLVDPAYKDDKEFIKKEIVAVRQGSPNQTVIAYLAWLEKNYERVGHAGIPKQFEDKAIDLFIRDEKEYKVYREQRSNIVSEFKDNIPEFNLDIKLIGEPILEVKEYFKKDKPKFVGRKDELISLYNELLNARLQVVIGGPQVGKKIFTLAYVHSYGAQKDLYPGGVFWFDFKKTKETEESTFKSFCDYLSVQADKENILSRLTRDKIHLELKLTLFIFSGVNTYQQIKKYLDLFQGDSPHHIIVISHSGDSWKKDGVKSNPLELKKFEEKSLEGAFLLAKYLNIDLDNEENITKCINLADKCDNYPGALVLLAAEITNLYDSSIDNYLNRKKYTHYKKGSLDLVTAKFDNNKALFDSITRLLLIFQNELKMTKLVEILAIWSFFKNNYLSESFLQQEFKLNKKDVLLLESYYLIYCKKNQNSENIYQISYVCGKALREIIKANYSKQEYPTLQDAVNIHKLKLKQNVKDIEYLKLDVTHISKSVFDIIDGYFKEDFLLERSIDFENKIFIPYALSLAKYFTGNKDKIVNQDIETRKKIAQLLLKCAYIQLVDEILSDAENIIKLAIELAREAYTSTNERELMIFYRIYGQIFKRLGNWDNAETQFKLAIDIFNKHRKFIGSSPIVYKLEFAATSNCLNSILMRRNSTNHKEILKNIQEALVIKRQCYPTEPNHPQIACGIQTEGRYYYERGEHEIALNKFREALKCLEAYYSQLENFKNDTSLLDRHRFILRLRFLVGKTLYFNSQFKDAFTYLNMVKNTLDQKHPSGKQHLLIASKLELAKIHFWFGNFEESKKILEALDNLQYYEREHPHPYIIDTVYYLGRIAVATGKFHEGLELFYTAYKMQLILYFDEKQQADTKENQLITRSFKDKGITYKRINNHEIAKIIHYIGFAYYKLHNYALAKALYEEANSINNKISIKHPKALLSDLGLGNIEYQKGNYTLAKEILSAVISKQQKAYGNDHFEIALTYRVLAKTSIKLFDYKEAVKQLNEAIRIWKKCESDGGINIPESAQTYFAKAMLLLTISNNFSEAETHLQIAYDKQKSMLLDINANPYIGQTLCGKAVCKWYQGQFSEAYTLFKQSQLIFKRCFKDTEQLNKQLWYIESLLFFGEFLYEYSYYSKTNNLFDISLSYYDIVLSCGLFSDKDPIHVRIFLGLTKIYYLKNDIEKSIDSLRNAETATQKLTYCPPDYLDDIKLQKAKLAKFNTALNTNEIIKLYEIVCTKDVFYTNKQQCPNLYLMQFDKWCDLALISKQITDFTFAIDIFYEIYPEESTDFKINGFSIETMHIVRNTKHFLHSNLRAIVKIRQILEIYLKLNKKQSTFKIEEALDKINILISDLLMPITNELCPTVTKKSKKYIFVCCGSSDHAPQKHKDAAKSLGDLLVKNSYGLIYGGGKTGLMGIVSDQILDKKGEAIAVVTPAVNEFNSNNTRVEKIIICDNYPERKFKMRELSSGIIVLPGGLGTLDEFADMLISNQFALFSTDASNSIKPVCLYNIDGFFSNFDAQIHQCLKDGYFKKNHLDSYFCSSNLSDIIDFIKNFIPPNTDASRWWDKNSDIALKPPASDKSELKDDNSLARKPSTQIIKSDDSSELSKDLPKSIKYSPLIMQIWRKDSLWHHKELPREEFESYQVALDSQRTINKVTINKEIKSCKVIPCTPDGNCGFYALERYLSIIGYIDISKKMNRNDFIALISKLHPSPEPAINTLIINVFKSDHADNIEHWKSAFASSNYWLQENHFKLLSYYYNLRINFFCLASEGVNKNTFQPELSNEVIDLGKSTEKINVNLVHISTKLYTDNDASLNHFESIIIEPNSEQESMIKKLLTDENSNASISKLVTG